MDDVKLTAVAPVPNAPDAMQADVAALAAGQPSPAETMRDDVTPDDVTPEVLKVIQTAAAMFLGRKVRVVSVKVGPTLNGDSSSWAHQGRDIVQASHNLVQRGRR